MPAMSVSDVFSLVTLMGLYLSDASDHQKAYKELLAYVDTRNVLMLYTVQHVIILFSRSKSMCVFALNAGDTRCTHTCPRCCDRDTVNEDSITAAPAAATPVAARRHLHALRAALAAALVAQPCVFIALSAQLMTTSKYWNKMGLDDYYHTFAAVLETNCVSPHQVLLEAGIDDFAHHNNGHALTAAAELCSQVR